MPRGDGTGPAGLGPMTGRAAGYCAGYSAPGSMNPVYGRGFGRFGGGRGRGFRGMYRATGLPGWARYNMGYPARGGVMPAPVSNIPPGQEADLLRNQVQYMQENLDVLNERIRELEKLEAGKEKPGK